MICLQDFKMFLYSCPKSRENLTNGQIHALIFLKPRFAVIQLGVYLETVNKSKVYKGLTLFS